MADTWAARWAAEWAAVAQRFDPYHVAAGNPAGGQFTTGGTSGGSGKTTPGKGGGREDRTEAGLKAQAAADRAQARELQEQLDALLEQAARAHAAAKKASAAARAHHATVHKAAAARKHAATTHRRHSAIQTRIGALRGQIHALLTQAANLDAQAARM